MSIEELIELLGSGKKPKLLAGDIGAQRFDQADGLFNGLTSLRQGALFCSRHSSKAVASPLRTPIAWKIDRASLLLLQRLRVSPSDW